MTAQPAQTTWSQLALGCEPLGGHDWGAVDLPRAREAVRCALDCGVSVFDTADIYGLGRGEEELGAALGPDRHRVTIVTKGGVRWSSSGEGGRSPTRRDASASYLSLAIEASLRRLRVEAIPLYLVHWPDPATPLEQTLECLEGARAEGKILAYGLSNFGSEALRTAAESRSISAFEGPLNLLSPASCVADCLFVRNMGVRTLTYGPLAQGLLTGKYSRDTVFPPSDRRHRLDHFSSTSQDRFRPVLEAVAQVSREVDRTPAQVALRWIVDSGAADAIIFGARSREQVLENCGTLHWSLEEGHLQRLEAARRLAGIAGKSQID